MIIYKKKCKDLIIPVGLGPNVSDITGYELQSKTVDSSTVEQFITSDVNFYGLYSVTVRPYILDAKTVDSSTVQQVITSDASALYQVIVNPYTLESKSQTITQNGEYSFTPESADGISRVDISVNVSDIPAVVQTKSVTYTENGEYSVEPDAGYDGLSHVDISVNIPVVPAELQDKTVDPSTSSITVEPDQGYDGLSSVTVAAIDSSLDPDLVPGNIKKDVEIFGVTGTFEGGTLGSKTVDSSTVSQTVIPDSSDYGLSSVTVNPYTLESKSRMITENGGYTFTPDNADGLSEVVIEVKTNTVKNQSKTVDSSTTIQYVQPDQGYTGLDYVAVNPYVLDTKTVNPSTNSQTVTSDEDGLSSVTVNAVTAAIDPDLVPGNIKKDVDILGVVGTFEGGTLQSKSVNSSTSSQTVIPDENNYGLSQVTVNPYTVESKSQTITVNGQYSFAPTNADALSGVNIDVSVADIPAVVQSKSVSYTANGQYSVTPDSGYDGLSSVNIDVSIDNSPELQSKTVNSSTSSQTVSPDQGYDGLSQVTVNPYSLENKTVNSSTSQQTISADNGYDGLNVVTIEPYVLDSKTVNPSTNSQTITSSEDGLSSVTVNAVTAAIDPDIQAGNIKKDVEILGVTGTYEGTVINNQNKSVDASTSSQTVTYDSSYTGLGQVTVNPYTTTALTVDASRASITYEPSTADAFSQVTVNAAVLQNRRVDASTVELDIARTSTSLYYGLQHVYINPVTASIDDNIQAGNIKDGVTILGVTGTFEGGTLGTKTVNSSTSSQTITPDSSDYGLASVTVNPYVLDSKTVDCSTEQQIITSDYDGLSSVTVNAANLQGRTYTPSKNTATIYPNSSNGYIGFRSVTIYGVTSSIDDNIQPENIKKDISILGVVGTYEGTTINNQNKTVNSSTSQQSVTADQGYTGLGTVTVNAVTSSIDPDIVPGNIKSGVNILGVTGTYTGGGSNLQTKSVTANTTFPASIYPDAGYDGISRLDIDIQGVDYNCNSVLSDSSIQDSSTYNVYAYVDHINIIPKMVDPVVVDASTVQQVITPVRDAISQVTVNAVDASIDSNIVAGNIKQGVTILGVTGNFAGGTLGTATVNPSTGQQVITPAQGDYGLSSVTVNAVTASIDSNITSGNIKDGVTILGVTGTYSSGSDYDEIYAALLEI